jgi:hypothetical protein
MWVIMSRNVRTTMADRNVCTTMADRNVRPPANTEQLVRLAGCAWPYEPEENTPEVGPLPARSNGHITFGSMNRPIKISERMIELWCRILHAVPNSKLIFLADAVASDVDYHYQRFARLGIGPDRLIPLARTPRRKYLESFSRIDFCVDTFPYAGDTTTCDGLWMGVPTLTLAGRSFHSRRGVSHLSNLGLEDWVAHGEEEYVTKAIGFASDAAMLARVRGELRQKMRQSALMDFAGYARRLEAAYRQMWERRCGDGADSSADAHCGNPHPNPPPEYRERENEAELLRKFLAANPDFHAPPGCGIVTACDGNLYRGLQMLLLSVNGCAPVAVFDLGLSDEQAAWCGSCENVRLMKPAMLPIPKSIEMWQAWNKPFYLKASPFECSIWIDADAFVMGDLSPLFAAAKEEFWVIKHQQKVDVTWMSPFQLPEPSRFSAPVFGTRKSRAVPVFGTRFSAQSCPGFRHRRLTSARFAVEGR